jgi:DeoR/GlpR family transcriptional regulator of sugar metabolism
MIDDGSAAGGIAPYLAKVRPLTVITNNLTVIATLAGTAGINVIALGGECSKKFHGFFGIVCEEALRSLRADIAFLSPSAIHGAAAFHQKQKVLQSKRLMIAAAERRCLCVDHSKVGRPALHFLTDLAAFDEALTGNAPDISHQTALTEASARLRIVTETSGE